jgi:hypothetical protein
VLTALTGLAKCRLLYTTNYDDFLERAYALRGIGTRSVVLENQMGRNGGGEVEIIKFHGDLNHPDQIVLTESDYERRLTLSSPLDARLKADLLGRTVIFMGYSFRDPNVSYLFRRVTEELEMGKRVSGQPRAFIALPDPSDFEYRLFRDRRIGVVALDGARVTDELAALIHMIGA